MRIAITQLGCIGDLVLATTAIDIIKSKYPKANIDFIVGRKNYAIVKNNPHIANCIVYDKNPVKLIPFLIKFLSYRYDFYIDPKDHYSTESAFLAKIVKANTKIGFNDVTKNHNLFDIGIPSAKENESKHFVEQIQTALAPLSSGSNANFSSKTLPHPNICLNADAINAVKQYLESQQISNYILLNISAGNTKKMWLPEKWIELITYLKTQTSSAILLSSDRPHADIADYIASKTHIHRFPLSPLQTVIALISKTDLLISPDTSLVHIATAFDINQIVLSNNVPNQLIKFAPLSPAAKVITSQQKDINVHSITVEQVKNVFLQIKL